MKMSSESELQLRKTIRHYILFFIFMIVINGIIVFPAVSVLSFLNEHLQVFPHFLRQWLSQVYLSVKGTNEQYPFLSYGTDWLAFGHCMIALVFVGALRDPVRNKWLFTFGMIACVLVIPYALVFGAFRAIPLWWRFIDCSFGIIGFIPMCLCRKWVEKLEE